MTGPNFKTQEFINELKIILSKNLGHPETPIIELAEKHQVSRQYLYSIVNRYLPELKKKYRCKPEKFPKIPLDDLERARRAKYRRKKQNAKTTGYEWTISYSDINWPTHCPILGLELDYFAEVRLENSASFDRIDSNKGYIPGNVVVISWRANRIKNDGSAEEHKKIYDYLTHAT